MKRILGLGLATFLVVGAAACTKKDSLVLLDLRTSGPLAAPVVRIKLSASGWTTRIVDGTIGPEGFRVGFYGPGDGGAVTVTAEAIAEAMDGADCVVGSGSATVPGLEAGATSPPTKLFVRALPGIDCIVDAGTDSGGGDGGDGGGDGGGDDGGGDAPMEAGTDAEVDAGGDAGADAGVDAAVDADLDAADADDDSGATPDAGAD